MIHSIMNSAHVRWTVKNRVFGSIAHISKKFLVARTLHAYRQTENSLNRSEQLILSDGKESIRYVCKMSIVNYLT